MREKHLISVETKRLELDETVRERLNRFTSNFEDMHVSKKLRMRERMVQSFEMVDRNREVLVAEKRKMEERMSEKQLMTFVKHKNIKEIKKKEIERRAKEMRTKMELKQCNAETMRKELKMKQKLLKKMHNKFNGRKNEKLEAEKLAEEFKNEEYIYKRQRITARLERAQSEKKKIDLEIIKKQYEILTKSMAKRDSQLVSSREDKGEGFDMLLKLPNYLYSLKKLSSENLLMKSPSARKRVFLEKKQKEKEEKEKLAQKTKV